jgi:hypothetical protein
MNHQKTTPAQREEIYRRVLAGESRAEIGAEFGVTKQFISLVVIKHRKAAAKGVSAAERSRRDLKSLIPEKLEALRGLVTTRQPAEAGVKYFRKWHAHSVRQIMKEQFQFNLLISEAGQLIIEWGLPHEQEYIPRRLPKEEVYDQDFYDYVNSDIGRQVRERSNIAEEREMREHAEYVQALQQGLIKRGRGRPRRISAPELPAPPPSDSAAPVTEAPATASPDTSAPQVPVRQKEAWEMPSLEEMERRLEEAARQMKGGKVQDVLDYYTPAPKKRGSNFTPKKKKRRK